MDINTILLLLPILLLVIYAVLQRTAPKTKTHLDDEAEGILASILEGLGKIVPSTKKEEKKDEDKKD